MGQHRLRVTTILVAISLAIGIARAQNPTTPGQGWNEEPVTPDAAQAFLESILNGEKRADIKGTIANTSEKDVNLGTHCSSSSTSTVNGNVSDSGTVTGDIQSNGSTSCRDLHDYFYWMTFAYIAQPSSGFIITARCDVRWRWNHCALPVIGATDGMVIEREKKGHYAIYIALRNGSLDRKGTVSKYEIVDLKHFTK